MGSNDDAFTTIKSLYSIALLIFSIIIITALQVTEQTKVAEAVHPALAIVLMWACIIWLGMVEGSQGSLVGLPPVQRDLYEESHPTTFKMYVYTDVSNVCDTCRCRTNLVLTPIYYVLLLSFAAPEKPSPVIT